MSKSKNKFPTAPVPRELEYIKKSYIELASRAAQTQYQIYVYTLELQQLNELMLQHNKEADERKNLDAASAKEKEVVS